MNNVQADAAGSAERPPVSPDPAELAALLQAGWLDGDLGSMARAPRSHSEVGTKVAEFATHCDDRYRAVISRLAAEGEVSRGVPR
ncbi:MAG: hypothetical protein JWQ81_1381 [Amycolatopsis sp.]|uniref:hypothetical protein n=1 Tax=Amycolatopsis sp. TaxID=37632 RepID=UPI002638F3BF|nr:hypothetical protein [Amycolatopsis sp.]MCU1680642.1 hypothetical protein [Amycolatopsis sp.]